MQLPAGKPAKLLPRLGGFEGKQKLAQLVGHRGRHALGASVLVELPQPFVAKADKLHVVLVAAHSLVCTVKPYKSRTLERINKIPRVMGPRNPTSRKGSRSRASSSCLFSVGA